MKPQVYKVIFEGDVLPGFGQLDVHKKVAEFLSIDEAEAARLFMDKQFEVERGVGLKQAKKYARALAKLGAITYLISQDEDDIRPPIMDDEGVGFTDSGSFDSLAFTSYFENKFKTLEEQEQEISYELIDPDDSTQPRACVLENEGPDLRGAEEDTWPVNELVDSVPLAHESVESKEREDLTLPGGYPVYTDVNKVREMQALTRRMLSKKRPYE